jgi:hypothetical protein
MKKKIIHLIGSTLLCSILAINMLTAPKTSFAAQKNVPKGIVFLKDNTLYKYDLNGDDKVDQIKCKYTNTSKGEFILKLYINNKLSLVNKNFASDYGVRLCDLDKNDNYLDLFIAVYPGNDYVMNAYFTRYNGKALDSKVAFNPQKLNNIFSSSYEIVKLDGNGKIYIRDYCLSNAIGNFMCDVPFQLKDNTVTTVPVDTYKFDKYYSTYQYKATKNFLAYEKAGSKKVAYTVKKGNKVTFDTLYISKSGKAYFRMKGTNGKTGWIQSDQKNLFVNVILAG